MLRYHTKKGLLTATGVESVILKKAIKEQYSKMVFFLNSPQKHKNTSID
jgi:hypothetical protein